jgi:hypothetical protein
VGFASYTGFSLWSDLNRRIEQFEERASQRVAEELQKVLASKKADIDELAQQLRRESAGAVLEAERARIASQSASKQIQDEKTTEDKNGHGTSVAALNEIGVRLWSDAPRSHCHP